MQCNNTAVKSPMQFHSSKELYMYMYHNWIHYMYNYTLVCFRVSAYFRRGAYFQSWILHTLGLLLVTLILTHGH